MSGLFIPTYGSSAEGSSTRVLPSKQGVSCNKRRVPSGMPSLVFNGNIEYVQSFEAGDEAASALEAAQPEVLGFDIEWQVSFVAGEAPRPTATLQLCAPEHPKCTVATAENQTNGTSASNPNSGPTFSSSSDQQPQQQQQQQPQPQQQQQRRRLQQSCPVWGTAYIFHLCHMRDPVPSSSPTSLSVHSEAKQHVDNSSTSTSTSTSSMGQSVGGHEQHRRSGPTAPSPRLPDSLVRVLSNPAILLAGVGVGGDVNRLEREYDQLRAGGGVGGVVDLSEVAKRKVAPERRRRGMWSLADLCAEVLELELKKPASLRTGSWEKRPLSVDQLFYAAADAYAGLRLWQTMHEMPDLVLQRSDPNGSRVEGTSTAAGSPRRCDVTAAAAGSEGKGQARAGVDARPARGGQEMATASRDAETTTPPRLPLSRLETHRLWHEDGLSVDAVAEVRCNKANTVRGYLSDCIEAGLPYDWTRVGIDADKEGEIVTALLAATAGSGKQPAVAAAGGDRGPSEAAAAAASSETSPKMPDHHKAKAEATNVGVAVSPMMPLASNSRPLLSDLQVDDGTGLATPTTSGRSAPAVEPVGTSCGHNTTTTTTVLKGPCSAVAAAAAASHSADGEVLPRPNPTDSESASPTVDAKRLAGSNEGSATSSTANSPTDSNPGMDESAGWSDGDAGTHGTLAGTASETCAAGRWDSVRLKDVKELAPRAEYWEIRMVLARLKSGYGTRC
ncbi:unnamed protein product [Ectocarpus sp. 12 AP-2014]